MEALRYITSIIKWLLIGIAALLLIGMFFGYRIYILESDSMSPKYPKGSIVVLDSKAKVSDLETDDVIGVMVGDSLVFHRVIGLPDSPSGSSTAAPEDMTEEIREQTYRLAGDRDPEKWTDVEITNGQLLGKMVLSVSGLGVVNGLFVHRTWLGWTIAAVIIGSVMVPWKCV